MIAAYSLASACMSTGLIVSESDCDDQDNCTFKGSWSDPISKGRIHARMTTTWTAANTEVFTMFIAGADGREMQMMEITYVLKP